MLLLYGFALERNPYNSVDVTVSIAPQTEKAIAKRVAAETKRRAEEGLDPDDIPVVPVDPLTRRGEGGVLVRVGEGEHGRFSVLCRSVSHGTTRVPPAYDDDSVRHEVSAPHRV